METNDPARSGKVASSRGCNCSAVPRLPASQR